jgi:hypothetical protein
LLCVLGPSRDTCQEWTDAGAAPGAVGSWAGDLRELGQAWSTYGSTQHHWSAVTEVMRPLQNPGSC